MNTILYSVWNVVRGEWRGRIHFDSEAMRLWNRGAGGVARLAGFG